MDQDKLAKYCSERNGQDREAQKVKLRNKLRGLIAKKMQTMMIGCLAELEKVFGESWGHGLLDSELDDQQLDMRAVWRICRSNILDFGNSQIRAIESELDNYNIEFK
jgi:hypothetical protein